jgi:redox-sensitive bicupin YhaK (pirin superfamily)
VTILPVTVEIRRGSTRFVEREPGRVTRHSFAFGADYDPARLSFGPMICHDDHLLGPGRGFDTHRHSGLEIVTWVVSGALRHTDSTGSTTVVPAGSVAVLSTGDGVEHSEFAADEGPCRFVQVWLRSDGSGAAPSYDVSAPSVASGGRTPLAEPLSGARLSLARIADGDTVPLPAAPRLHVYVVTGALLRSSLAEPLSEGDAFEMTDEPSHEVKAGVPTDLLVWEFTR